MKRAGLILVMAASMTAGLPAIPEPIFNNDNFEPRPSKKIKRSGKGSFKQNKRLSKRRS